MKKIVCCMLALLMVLSALPVSAAEAFVRLDASASARVAEVIDGDAILVRGQNGQVALVKLIGVDTMGRMDAFEYLTSRLLGNDVLLVLDANVSWDGRWNYAYAYRLNELVNGTILQSGLGRLNASHDCASLYSSLGKSQNLARASRVGIWADPDYPGGIILSGLQVNINTATASQISSTLSGVTSTVASAIVAYREKNPFRTVEDVKFVKGFTKAMFDRNRFNMAVSTNMLTATQEELGFLRGISASDVTKIVEYRLRNGVTDLRNLVTNGCITQTQYNNNLPYIALEDVFRITRTVPSYTANINTATKTQLTNAGLSNAQADQLIALRGTYTFKSLYDVGKALSLNEEAINHLADNLTVWTEINLAAEHELRSLFGTRSNAATLAAKLYARQPFARLTDLQLQMTLEEFNLIAPYIYKDVIETNYINANTASVEQMVNAGILRSAADKLHAQAGKMTSPDKIPAEARSYSNRFTLHTNINTASYGELSSLHKDMTVTLVNAILEYRIDQPFGTAAEVELFFKEQKETAIYDKIKSFLVTR